MKNKAIIFGSGSIGTRHASLLQKLKISNILIFSKRKNKKFRNTSLVSDLVKHDPDYLLVCSETYKHKKQLQIIEKNFKNKKVLVEKPLFHKPLNINLKNNNYFVGYNLRFHPVIKFLKNKIKKQEIFSISILCHSFLPNWRKNIKYYNSYSSFSKKGGGVLLDLSHEIDYMQWLFGKVKKIEFKKVKKLSNLKIKSEDFAQISGKIKNINFNLNLTYFSRFQERKIVIDSKKETIIGDLINHEIKIINNKKSKKLKFKINKNQTYIDQHLALMKNDFKSLCTIKEANNILKFIEKIKL